MGKQGPCCHCGITTTPLWRNGPPDKPVLCNACGSRWRTKGTLVNYMPMHSGGCGVMSDSSSNPFQGRERSHKWRKPCKAYANIEDGIQRPNFSLSRGLNDLSTRSTGSEISCSEGFIQRNACSGRKFSVFWSGWDFSIPSRRRTPLCRRQLSSEKIFKLQSLLFGPGVFVRSAVAVHGEESVSSSLFFESKKHHYSDSSKQDLWKGAELPVQFTHGVSKPSFQGKEKMKKKMRSMKARKSFLDKNYNVLHDYHSSLTFLELKDIINVDTFLRLLTKHQSELITLTSSADVLSTEESLKDMFNSSQFEAALANFQLLLSKGMFKFTESGIYLYDLQLYLQLLEVTDLTSSGWMERWSQLVNHNKHSYSSHIGSKDHYSNNVKKGRPKVKNVNTPKNMIEKRFPSRSLGHVMVGKSRHSTFGSYAFQSLASPSLVASKTLQSGKMTKKGSSSKDFISFSKNRSYVTADSLHLGASNNGYFEHYNSMSALMNDLADTDMLLDVPSSMSFQQAELLPQAVWNRNQQVKVIDQYCNASLRESTPVANALQEEKNID